MYLPEISIKRSLDSSQSGACGSIGCIGSAVGGPVRNVLLSWKRINKSILLHRFTGLVSVSLCVGVCGQANILGGWCGHGNVHTHTRGYSSRGPPLVCGLRVIGIVKSRIKEQRCVCDVQVQPSGTHGNTH